MDNGIIIIAFLWGMDIGMIIHVGIYYFVYQFHKTTITDSTANDICKSLTNNSNARYVEGHDFRLHCEIPSDHTNNIVIKRSGE